MTAAGHCPGHQIIEVVLGANLAEDLSVPLGQLATHLAL